MLGLAICVGAPLGAAVTSPSPSVPAGPFASGTLGMPAVPRLAAMPAVSSAELTARLLDSRTRPALPHSHDLASTDATSVGSALPAIHAASMLTDSAEPPRVSAPDGSVTGAAMALGAPDASSGGVGSESITGSGSGGSASAVIAGPAGPPQRTGVTLARLEPRTTEMHASIQPLERPG